MNQNKRPYIIVITGGIATGKSQASGYIKSLGYTVLDSDKIVHEGYRKSSELYKELITVFSEDILDDSQYIDRQKLGRIVLNDNNKLKLLNSMVHSYVIHELISFVDNCEEKLIFLDIPLMFEQKDTLNSRGLEYDEIWLIYVSEETQRKRLIQRAMIENKDIDQALSIINKQMPIEQKKRLADRIISNEGTIDELNAQILSNLHEIFS